MPDILPTPTKKKEDKCLYIFIGHSKGQLLKQIPQTEL